MKSDCMKALFTATVKSHIGQFHMPFIKELQARGYEVHAAYKDNSNQKQGLDTSAIENIRGSVQSQSVQSVKYQGIFCAEKNH